MAHFVQLNENNIVINGVVVNNEDIIVDGVESEQAGIDFCANLFGGVWKQTSYNGRFRKNYAGHGYKYDATRDAFIPPIPYEGWTLVEETCLWEPKVRYTDDGKTLAWDKDALTWIEVTTIATMP